MRNVQRYRDHSRIINLGSYGYSSSSLKYIIRPIGIFLQRGTPLLTVSSGAKEKSQVLSRGQNQERTPSRDVSVKPSDYSVHKGGGREGQGGLVM